MRMTQSFSVVLRQLLEMKNKYSIYNDNVRIKSNVCAGNDSILHYRSKTIYAKHMARKYATRMITILFQKEC